MKNFNLWLKITEIKNMLKNTIEELKNRKNLKESVSNELEGWNDSFNLLFNTSDINWVNIAMMTGSSIFDRRSEAFATVLGETFTDAYMCMSQGINPMTRGVEKGIKDASMGTCPETRKEFLKILSRPDEEKMRWFFSVIKNTLIKRTETYLTRSKIIKSKKGERRKQRRVDYDEYIRSNKIGGGSEKIPRGTVLGSGDVMSTDDETRTLSDQGEEATTLMTVIRNKLNSMKSELYTNDTKIDNALRMLDMIANKEIEELGQNIITKQLGISLATSARVLELIRLATEEARKELGLTSGMRYTGMRYRKSGKGRE
jgi:hypothetical protein